MRLASTFICLLLAFSVSAQVVVSDSYNVAANGSGFGLDSGVNAGINPPTTRLTGTAAANLVYIPTATKSNTAFSIAGNKLRVTSAANPGRFVLSADGVTPFNFASALGTGAATPQNPVVYDLSIRMANNSIGVQRFSFALGTAEGDATTWDFGIQVFRTANSDTFYTIGKRIDLKASGLAADLNTFITNTAIGTYGTEISLLMRVTDAGNETSSFNSRVQLSFDGGFTWFYDTATDPDLPNGWRLMDSGRYVMWDIAPDAGNVTYDDFALRLVPVSATLLSPTNNSQNLGASAQLRAFVTNSASGKVTATFYTREAPTPYPGPDFTIAALPDTQNYARQDSAVGNAVKEMWYSQTEWVITNRVAWNIAYVAGLGDCVQNGDILNGNNNSTEWQIATNAMYRLESPARTLLRAGVPYGEAVGNHDQEPNGDPDGTTENYNDYFGSDHFINMPYYGGHFSTNNDSWFQLFSASGLDFIVISFEYDRYGSTIMNWATDVLATNQNRRVIVVTHNAGSDTTPVNFSTQGQTIYDTLKVNTNFFLMLAGHRFANDGEGSRSDTYQGRTVWTLVSDYQGRTNGGNGLMRLMTFSPSNNVIRVKTFSPWTGQYETDADSQFNISYNMQPNGPGSPGTPFVAIATNSDVVPGSTTTATFSGLKANTTYEWYVKVTDASGNTITTPSSLFTTGNNAVPLASNLTFTVVGDQPSDITLAGYDANGDALTFQTNTAPAHGSVTSFDTNSGAVTYLPLHGFRGTDRFTYHANDSSANGPIATIALNVVAPPDINSNGLPDSWENEFGVTDPNADDDGDGQSNLAEYLANTDPTDASSSLKILSANYQTNGTFSFTWRSAGNTRYRVQYADAGSTNFVDIVRPIQVETDPATDSVPSTQTFIDTTPSAPGPRFYRVKVIQ